MESEEEFQDLYSRIILQLRQIRTDLVHLTEKYVEAHGFHNLGNFDMHGGTSSMGSEDWMEMAVEERMVANITAYINLEQRLIQVMEEQAEHLLQRDGDLHEGLQNLLKQVTALRLQLEYLGSNIGLNMSSEEGIDDIDIGASSIFEKKVKGYHVLRELSVWAVRSVRDLRKLQKKQEKLANTAETSTEGNGQ